MKVNDGKALQTLILHERRWRMGDKMAGAKMMIAH